MPIGFRSSNGRRGGGKSHPVVVDLQDLVQPEAIEFPLVCQVVSDSSLTSSPAGSPDAKNPDPSEVLTILGVTQCSAVNLRHPVSPASSPGSPPASSRAQIGHRGCPEALVCLADRNTLFEVISGDSMCVSACSNSTVSSHVAKEHQQEASTANGYAYDGRLYSTLRSLLTQHQRMVGDNTQTHGLKPLRISKLPGPFSPGKSLTNTSNEEYIVFPCLLRSLVSGGGSGGNKASSGSNMGQEQESCHGRHQVPVTVAAWRVTVSAGHTHLQAADLPLEEVGRWKVCHNVEYLDTRGLAAMLSEADQDQESPDSSTSSTGSVLVRALPTPGTTPAPFLCGTYQQEETTRLLPLHASGLTSKPFILASYKGQCYLLSRDIHLSVSTLSVSGENPVCNAYHCTSSALTSLLFSSPALCYGLCSVHVCDQPISKQLTRKRIVSTHSSLLNSLSSLSSTDTPLWSPATDIHQGVFNTFPNRRRSSGTPSPSPKASTLQQSTSSEANVTPVPGVASNQDTVQRRTSAPELQSPGRETIDPYSWVRRSKSFDPEEVSRVLQTSTLTSQAGLAVLAEHEGLNTPPPLPNRGPSPAATGTTSPHHVASDSPVSPHHCEGNDDVPPKLPQKKKRRSIPQDVHVHEPDDCAPVPPPRNAFQQTVTSTERHMMWVKASCTAQAVGNDQNTSEEPLYVVPDGSVPISSVLNGSGCDGRQHSDELYHPVVPDSQRSHTYLALQ